MIKVGPVGIGGVGEAVSNLGMYGEKGFGACEIPFTYGVYFKEKHGEVIKKVRKKSLDLGIDLSIHGPYWINLNSKKEEVIKKSKKRILKSARVGEKLGAKRVVFHPGFYCGKGKEESYDNIREGIEEVKRRIEDRGWNIKLAPETTGKVNVFGNDEEILGLVKDTGCSLCIDFAHLLARSKGERSYVDMVESFGDFKDIHAHFSGIDYGEKGEKKHISTPVEEIEKLFEALPKDKNITLISEDPNPVEGATKIKEVKDKLKIS